MKILITVCLLLFIFLSCKDNGVKIIDHYRVYKYVDFDYNGNHIKAKNVLMCKLASKNDPFIKNVTQVEWDESTIIAKTNNSYFVIKSSSYGLCCSCGNKVIGPLNEAELKNYKTKEHFIVINKEEF